MPVASWVTLRGRAAARRPDVADAVAAEDAKQQAGNRTVRLEVMHRAAEITLKRRNQQRSDHARDRGAQQEESEIGEQTLAEVSRDIQLDPLRDEWP
ncbi:hypothetical protein BMMON2_02500 [Burkholderia mallei]